jgi:flagellar basal-body rod protein FlgG
MSLSAVHIASTGMVAQELNVEVISNNIANLTTTAFTRRRAEFQDLLYQEIVQVGTTSTDGGSIVPTGVQIGLGVHAAATYRITERGNLLPTDNTLDVAIRGKGYFQVTLPDGDTAYTRAGAFQLDANAQIVTPDGYPVQPGITIPANVEQITINASGEVLVNVAGAVGFQNVGQIELAQFPNENGLLAIGDNLFLETPGSGAPVTGTANTEGYGDLLQGFLETSNVEVVKEISNLIAAQRAYEMNTKVIETADQMLQSLNQVS